MKQYLISLAGAIILMSCANPEKGTQKKSEDLNNNQKSKVMETKNLDTATFGGGCFWCVEAVYQQLNGVVSVASGYSGGPRANPSYEQVCSGATGHAEVIQIVYDATKISFDELLQVFWTVHDPTTLNRQGADVGTQYRSVVFYHNENQKELTKSYIEKLNAEHVLIIDDVVTTGTTMRCAASALRGAGAGEVTCVAIASALRHDLRR